VAEAADLSEGALRPVVSLDDRAQQNHLVTALATEQMAPVDVRREVRRLTDKSEPNGEDQRQSPYGDVTGSLRLLDGELPDPAELAAEVARLSVEEQERLWDRARRLVAFLRSFLEAEGTEG
jgi:hypothetical protein